MKKYGILLILTMVLHGNLANAQVGIGTSTPDSSAVLDLKDSTKGFLPPRLTTAQRNAVAKPARGLMIYNFDSDCLEFWNGTGWFSVCDGSVTLPPPSCQNDTSAGTGAIVQMMYDYNGDGIAEYNWCAREVSAAGFTWLDRNLGAYRMATSSTDSQSYGDLYQWGRRMDGHQKRVQRSGFAADEGNATQGVMVNDTTSTNADVPANALFITESSTPFDWRVNQNSTLWSGVAAVNNPCPTGYRLPTQTELQALNNSFSAQNSAGAFSSPVKMPEAGGRYGSTGSLLGVGFGGYWSSTVSGSLASFLLFDSSNSDIDAVDRTFGFSVRCIKD